MKLLLKNKKKLDCGIIAAFNMAAWCNSPKTYEELEKLAKTCGYSPKKGIFFFQFANLIKKMKLPTKRIRSTSIQELEDKLSKGKCFVFLYTLAGEDNGHAMMVFSDHLGRFKIINPQKSRSKTWWDFAWDVQVNGVRNMAIYEIPRRKSYDDARSS